LANDIQFTKFSKVFPRHNLTLYGISIFTIVIQHNTTNEGYWYNANSNYTAWTTVKTSSFSNWQCTPLLHLNSRSGGHHFKWQMTINISGIYLKCKMFHGGKVHIFCTLWGNRKTFMPKYKCTCNTRNFSLRNISHLRYV